MQLRGTIFLLSLFVIILLVGSPVHAAICFYETQDGLQCSNFDEEEGVSPQQVCEEICNRIEVCKKAGNYRLGTGNTCPPPPTRLENPIFSQGGEQISIPLFIGQVVSGSLALVGALTLLVFIYGGFLWLTSAGNEEKINKGLHAMLYAAIGLFIIFASYGILSAVLKGLGAGGG